MRNDRHSEQVLRRHLKMRTVLIQNARNQIKDLEKRTLEIVRISNLSYSKTRAEFIAISRPI